MDSAPAAGHAIWDLSQRLHPSEANSARRDARSASQTIKDQIETKAGAWHAACASRSSMSTPKKTMWLAVAMAASSAVVASPVRAQTCVASNANHYTADDRREFRVSSVFDGALSGVTDVEFQRAAAQAAATWNEQTATRPFFYNGLSSRTDLPDTKQECDDLGIDYSLVRVDIVTDTGSKGVAQGRCYDGSGRARQFLISIYQDQADGSLRSWESNGSTIGSTEFDLLQTMTHEFGHTLRLGHPSGEYGTMRPTTIGTNRQRDLYLWDMSCLRTLSGAPDERQTRVKRIPVSGGALGSESTPFSALGKYQSKGSPGITWVTGSTEFSAAAQSSNNTITPWWTRGLNNSNTNNFPSTVAERDLVSMFTEATFREDTSQDRVIYITPDEYPTSLASGSEHRVAYRRSSNGFSSSNWGTLRACSGLSGFLRCSGTQYIYSGKPPAVSWDYEVDRTIFAWVNQNRSDNTDTREIRISVGYVNNYTLNQPIETGIQSNVTPGIACRTNQALGHNCLMAYVDQTDGLQRIKLRRFTPVRSGNRYILQWHPTTTTFSSAVTASRIAVWYHDGQWWLAYRTSSPGQRVNVFTSATSSGWVSQGAPTYSDVGPTAVSYWAGNNQLFFAE